jgi:hypothetical protein
MNLKSAALLAVICMIIGCGLSEEARQVKLYQNRLGAMLGREDRDIRKQIKEEFRFELLDRWKAENPGPETVVKNNYRVHGFSREEAREEFGIPGIYEVEIYSKKQAAETARIEQINQMGQTIPDTRHTLMTNEFYTYIRVVFRDAALIRVDVWRR